MEEELKYVWGEWGEGGGKVRMTEHRETNRGGWVQRRGCCPANLACAAPKFLLPPLQATQLF